MENEIKTMLYAKMLLEQDRYRNWLLAQTPAEVLNHAYEYTVREEILLYVKEQNLSVEQSKALLKSPCPLSDVFQEFNHRENALAESIQDSIETEADKTIQKEKINSAKRNLAEKQRSERLGQKRLWSVELITYTQMVQFGKVLSMITNRRLFSAYKKKPTTVSLFLSFFTKIKTEKQFRLISCLS